MKKLTLGVFIAAVTAAQAASITDFGHGMNSAGQYELVFKGAQVLPNVFTTTGPDAIVLDFINTNSKIGKREISIGNSGIYDVDIVDTGEQTRAVVNLAAPSNYRVMQRGQDIVVVISSQQTTAISPTRPMPTPVNNTNGGLFNNVTFSGTANHSTPATPVQISTPTSTPKATNTFTPTNTVPVTPEPPSLTPRFIKKNSNTAALTFGLPATSGNVNIRQDGNKIIASINGYYAPRSDLRRMEVGSYATVVNYVDVVRTARGTDVVLGIKRNQPFEFSSFQNGDIYTVEVKKPRQDQNIQKQVEELVGFGPGKNYKGAPLSLNFQDIEVRAVLQIIAEFTNNNVVVSDAVAGNITLRLDNVPWDQALDIILKTKGLGMRQNGSVIYIAPSSELDQREIDALRVIQERDQLVPTRTELIQVKYSNASDLAAIINQSRAGIGGNEFFKDSILSSKGTVTVDARTNTLLVSDIPSKLQVVRELIARLDEPVRQVLVDARLVLTSDEFSRSLGSKFGLTFFNAGNNGLVSGSGKVSAASDLNNTLVNNAAAGGNSTIVLPNIDDRLGVKLPSPGSSYGLAILGADFLVDLELSALQTEGKAEIVSSPRVVTQDGKKARIASGQQIPYTSAAAEGGTNVRFQNAELSLDVTPRIAPDNRVDMVLNVTKDSPNAGLQSGGNIGINTNQLETNVLVDNGETIVLGGIYEQNQSLSTEKVPLLGDLPLIGNAFKTNTKRFNKSELIIFVTPRIIENRLTDYDKFSNLRN